MIMAKLNKLKIYSGTVLLAILGNYHTFEISKHSRKSKIFAISFIFLCFSERIVCNAKSGKENFVPKKLCVLL